MDFLMRFLKKYFPVYLLVVSLFVGSATIMTRTVTAIAEALPIPRNVTIVIDPGHGGEDGGATSCTGIQESQLNLEISLRLRDLLHFLGYRTKMIRTTDTSVYTNGATISEKKISDLKHRVEMVNETADALLLSIHQNQFSDGRYSGAQVFFAPTQGSQSLAEQTQALLISSLNPGSKRACKPAESDAAYPLHRNFGGMRLPLQSRGGSGTADAGIPEKAVLRHCKRSGSVLDPRGRYGIMVTS